MAADWRLIMIMAFCVTTIASAQNISLRGKVVDTKGVPIAGAEVELRKNGVVTFTDSNGLFTLSGVVAGVTGSFPPVDDGRISVTRQFLDLGENTDAIVTAYSLGGERINRIETMGERHIAMERILPGSGGTQTLILSIGTSQRNVTFRIVRCGNRWLWNGQSVRVSIKGGTRAAALPVVDTILVSKELKQYTYVPVRELSGTLPDIVMLNVYEPPPEKQPATLLGDVVFSEPSRTFKGQLSVTMTTAVAGAEIRYTTDGTAPAAASTPYANTALSFSATTQLRAAAFVGAVASGLPSTALYIARAIDVTSDVPLILIDGYGKGKPSKDKSIYLDIAIMTFELKNGKASLSDVPTMATRAGYHLRGQSSMMFEQAPYKIELWDNENNDADYPVLGMPKGSDWALISPYTDNTLIRNVFAFSLGASMGLTTMQYRFAEVYINQDAAPLDTSDYQGVYTLVQTIKNESGRLDLKQLKPEDTEASKLSGGYILKFDQMAMDSTEKQLECTGAKKMSGGFGTGKVDSTATCWADLELVDPAPANSQQIAWITNYCQQFHNALHAKPVGNWRQYIDVSSFTSMFILNEITRNVDAWIRSAYMHKERNGLLKSGPVWDYNFALDNFARDSVGWHVEENRRGSADWHTMLWKQPEFKSAVKARWNELRPTLLSDASVAKRIDDVRAPIVTAAERDLVKWPIGKSTLFGGGAFGTDTLQPKTWAGQIDNLKSWTKKRMKSLDSSMATLP